MELLLAEEGRADEVIGARVPIWVAVVIHMGAVVTHMGNNWASV